MEPSFALFDGFFGARCITAQQLTLANDEIITLSKTQHCALNQSALNVLARKHANVLAVFHGINPAIHEE